MLLEIFTAIHVAFGLVAFVSSLLAVAAPKGQSLHVVAGRIFTVAMAGIFVSAMLIAIFNPRLFLILVAIFSVYLAVSGYWLAKNRQPKATAWQWRLSITACLVAISMAIIGILTLMQADQFGIVLLAFAAIMLGFSIEEIIGFYKQSLTGKNRIAAHFSRMLGGSIAIFTAATVVNLDIEPRWLQWLLPTLFIAPVIIFWNIKLRC